MMKVEKIGAEILNRMFEEAFKEQVASRNKIDSFEADSSFENSEMVVRVKIYEIGECPSFYDFKNKKIEDANVIQLKRDDIEACSFYLCYDEIYVLGSNDFRLTYRKVV